MFFGSFNVSIFFFLVVIEGFVFCDSVLFYFGEKNVIVNSIKNIIDVKLWYLFYNINII